MIASSFGPPFTSEIYIQDGEILYWLTYILSIQHE